MTLVAALASAASALALLSRLLLLLLLFVNNVENDGSLLLNIRSGAMMKSACRKKAVQKNLENIMAKMKEKRNKLASGAAPGRARCPGIIRSAGEHPRASASSSPTSRVANRPFRYNKCPVFDEENCASRFEWIRVCVQNRNPCCICRQYYCATHSLQLRSGYVACAE